MTEPSFAGFLSPEANFSKLPHDIVNAMPIFTSMGEVLITIYILRHTWGFGDDDKRITLDEFMYGRKRRINGEVVRIDNGVGMSKTAIIRGIKKALEHGFINVEVDDSDRGRIEKYYSLRLRSDTQEYRNATSDVSKRNSRGSGSRRRSEKDTKERNKGKKQLSPQPPADPSENAFAVWARLYGSLTGLQIEHLKDIQSEFGDETVTAEIKAAHRRHPKTQLHPDAIRRLLQYKPLTAAIMQAFGYDPESMTGEGFDRIYEAAQQLKSAGYSTEDVKQIYDFCNSKGWSSFSVKALVTNAPDWKRQQSSAPTSATPAARPVSKINGAAMLETFKKGEPA